MSLRGAFQMEDSPIRLLDFYRRLIQTKKFVWAQINIFVWQEGICNIYFCQTKIFIWCNTKKCDRHSYSQTLRLSD